MKPFTHVPTFCLVGATGTGKTVEVLRALGKVAVWLTCEPGALMPATAEELNPWRVNCAYREGDDNHKHSHACGPLHVPREYVCLDPDKPYEEVIRTVKALIPKLGTEFGAVVIDTLSAFASRESRRIIDKDGVAENYGRAKGVLARRVGTILDLLLPRGVAVVAICHERDPSTIDGKFTPGGALLPGDLAKHVQSLFDGVYRCDYDIDATGKTTRVFRCDPTDRTRLTRDRLHLVNGKAPMDLAPIVAMGIKRASMLRGVTA